MTERWKVIQTNNKSPSEVFQEVKKIVTEAIQTHNNGPLDTLWPQ